TAHFGQQAFAQHLEQIETGHAGGGLQVGGGAATELQDRHGLVDHNAHGSEASQDNAVGLLLDVQGAPQGGTGLAHRSRYLDGGRDVRTEVDGQAAVADALLVNLVLRIRDRKEFAAAADVLRGAQHQEAAGRQGVMEDREDAPLQGRIQVDQHVAATDQVEARKGRVGDHVVPRKDAQVAHGLADLVAAVDPDEIAPQPLLGDVEFDVVDVDAGAGLLQGRLVQVGRQDLDGHGVRPAGQVLQQADGQRVDFLARGAAGDPDADRRLGGTPPRDLGKDLFLEGFEQLGVAEELGDADEEVLVKLLLLQGIIAQKVEVVLDRLEALEGDAPLDAAADGGPLVVREIDRGVCAQQVDDLVDDVALFPQHLVGLVVRPGVGVADDAGQLPGDFARRQDVIDVAVGD